MAGIGFEIRKLMDEQTYTGDFKAYFFAGILSSGPWIISILCLAFLWVFSAPFFGIQLLKLFRVVVVYTYAYSLITTGFLQFTLTRFLSDKLFLKQRNLLLPTYIGVLLVTVIFQGLIATVFYSFSQVDLHFKIIGIILFIAVSCIWQTMIFLSASRDFMAIVSAFFWGNLISFICAVGLGQRFGFNGYLLGFTIGQAAVTFLLMYRIFYEFNSTVLFNFEFLRYTKKYINLFFIGVFYYIAIWIDKIIYWYVPSGAYDVASGEHIKDLFYSHYPYDSCMFLAFLTIMPALAHFMIDVETNFYESYREFYGSIVNKGSFTEIMRRKNDMLKILREASTRMILLQTVITGAFIFYAPQLTKFLNLQPEDIIVLRTAGLGTYFHVFLLLSLIMLLYFDRRKAALAAALVFLLTNTLFTLYVVRFAPYLMGVGYAASAFLSSIFALVLLRRNVKSIEFLTFVEQPLKAPKLPQASTEKI
jgi:uncharacterized membrane protein